MMASFIPRDRNRARILPSMMLIEASQRLNQSAVHNCRIDRIPSFLSSAPVACNDLQRKSVRCACLHCMGTTLPSLRCAALQLQRGRVHCTYHFHVFLLAAAAAYLQCQHDNDTCVRTYVPAPTDDETTHTDSTDFLLTTTRVLPLGPDDRSKFQSYAKSLLVHPIPSHPLNNNAPAMSASERAKPSMPASRQQTLHLSMPRVRDLGAMA